MASDRIIQYKNTHFLRCSIAGSVKMPLPNTDVCTTVSYKRRENLRILKKDIIQ